MEKKVGDYLVRKSVYLSDGVYGVEDGDPYFAGTLSECKYWIEKNPTIDGEYIIRIYDQASKDWDDEIKRLSEQ
jgi:hypothetical protein